MKKTLQELWQHFVSAHTRIERKKSSSGGNSWRVNAVVFSIYSMHPKILPHDRTYAQPYARTIDAIWMNFIPPLPPVDVVHIVHMAKWEIVASQCTEDRLLLIINYNNKTEETQQKRKQLLFRLISHVCVWRIIHRHPDQSWLSALCVCMFHIKFMYQYSLRSRSASAH